MKQQHDSRIVAFSRMQGKRLLAVPQFRDLIKQLEWQINSTSSELRTCTGERQRSAIQQKIGRLERELQREKMKKLIGVKHGEGTTVP